MTRAFSDHSPDVHSIKVELFGSLGATGIGLGSHEAFMLGLEGELPETVNTDLTTDRVNKIRDTGELRLLDEHVAPFTYADHLIQHRRKSLPGNPNGMRFSATDVAGSVLGSRIYDSVGGGVVVDEDALGLDRIKKTMPSCAIPLPWVKCS